MAETKVATNPTPQQKQNKRKDKGEKDLSKQFNVTSYLNCNVIADDWLFDFLIQRTFKESHLDILECSLCHYTFPATGVTCWLNISPTDITRNLLAGQWGIKTPYSILYAQKDPISIQRELYSSDLPENIIKDLPGNPNKIFPGREINPLLHITFCFNHHIVDPT